MTTADFMRQNRPDQTFGRVCMPLPAYGHMPFIGHRTMGQHWARAAAATRKNLEAQRRAAAYGCEPTYARVYGDD